MINEPFFRKKNPFRSYGVILDKETKVSLVAFIMTTRHTQISKRKVKQAHRDVLMQIVRIDVVFETSAR